MTRTLLNAINAPTELSTDYGNSYFEIQNSPVRYIFMQRSDVTRNVVNDSGWRQPSPYAVDINTFSGPRGRWDVVVGGYYRIYRGNLYPQMNHRAELQLPGEIPGLRSQAEVGALLKLKDQRVNLAQAFAERGQVVDMFVSNITRVASAYRDLKRGRIRSAAAHLGIVSPRRMPRELADRWLELQYGWKPLLSDVHGTIEEFAKSDALPNYRVSVSQNKQVKTALSLPSLAYGTGYLPYDSEIKKSVKYRVRLDYLPSCPELVKFSSLGLTNPASLAWELVPFSFVADWVIPIGDWLSVLDAAAGYTYLGGTCTETREVIARLSGGSGVLPGSTAVSHSDIDGKLRTKCVRRTVYPSSPIPTLPRAKNPWSFGRAANAAALLTQVTSGAKPPRNR